MKTKQNSLLRPTHGLLKQVASHFAFEAAVGANGAVWVRANETRHVMAVKRVLEVADLARTQCESEGHEDRDEEEVQVDAEHVVKNRASGLDAKRVRAIVNEFL